MSQQLNLFNPIFLREKKYFSSHTMVRGLGVVLAALIVMYGFQRVQLAGMQKQLAEANKQFETTQQQLTRFTTAAKRTPSKALEDEEVRIEAQLKAQESLISGLESGELGNAEGFSQYLTALARQTLPGVWLTGFSATGADGPSMIRGRLLRPELLPTYLRMLNREDALRGHGFADFKLATREEKPAASTDKAASASTNATEPTRYVEFTLGAAKAKTANGATR